MSKTKKTKKNQPRPLPCTDTGNMERFIRDHRHVIKSGGHDRQWYVWTGQRWKPSPRDAAFNLALKTVENIGLEAVRSSTPSEAEELRKWHKTSQSEAKTNAMLKMAAQHETISVSAGAFDSDRMLLNCANGLVDLRTGELLERGPEHLVSKLVDVDYDPTAKCPTFDKFIGDIFCGDKELIRWVQRALGYAITGSVNEQLLFIAYGTGANGKSTLFELINKLLSDYSRATDFELFLSNQKSDVRMMEAIGELKGTRLALASESDGSKRFNETVLKRLTGGDTLRGTKLQQTAFEFKPEFKIWMLANHLPFARDGSHGFWRRIKIVPFARQFTTEEIDTTLPYQLEAEAKGVLRWLVEGAVAWHRRVSKTQGKTGLGPCAAIDASVDQYRYDNDHASRFIEECLTVEDGAGRVGARDLYNIFSRWSHENGFDDLVSENIFSRRMEERGLKKKRTKAGVEYEDVAVTSSTSTTF